jgi:deoxyhypusine synthase
MAWLANWYVKNSEGKGLGFFQIGGGIAGDFPICVVPMLYQDMEMENIPFWSYFCQISDSTTSYGSYSGAVPNEKITWGKLDIHTPKFIVESDATIVAPLMFAWILGWLLVSLHFSKNHFVFGVVFLCPPQTIQNINY